MSPESSKINKYLFSLFIAIALMAPVCFLYAETVPAPTPPAGPTLLAPLTGLNTPGSVVTQTGLAGYLQTLFWLAITLAGVLAVLMIVKGGVLYMTSEAFNTKAEAKKQITMAIVGFLLAISSVLILTTINPDLLKFKLLVRPLVFTLPDIPNLVARASCAGTVDAKVISCVWAVRGALMTRCDEAVVSKFGPVGNLNYINLAPEACKNPKTATENQCCGFIPQKNGCSGIGIYNGKKECSWASPSLPGINGCTKPEFQSAHPGFAKDDTLLFCAGIRPASGFFTGTSDCCVK